MSNYLGCKGELNTTLFDRYYSQNCKAITFRRVTNHTKHILTNIPSYQLNFDKVNHSFLYSFRLGGNRFSKYFTWSFGWGTGTRTKIHRLNALSKNVNTLNQKIFCNTWWNIQVREMLTNIL